MISAARSHWRRTLTVIGVLLAAWAAVTFVPVWLAPRIAPLPSDWSALYVVLSTGVPLFFAFIGFVWCKLADHVDMLYLSDRAESPLASR